MHLCQVSELILINSVLILFSCTNASLMFQNVRDGQESLIRIAVIGTSDQNRFRQY